MERKEYDVPNIDVIATEADDVITTSKIILPPHVIGRPHDDSDQY